MTPLKVMPVSFILLCALIGGSFAPVPVFRPQDAGVGSSDSTLFSGSLTRFSSGMGRMEQEHQLITSLLRIMGRFELPSLADGSHLVVPLAENTDLEKEYKTVAIAASKLLMNLKSMERCENFQWNVTGMLVSKLDFQQINDTGPLDGFLRTFWHSYIEGIDNKFGTDEELATEYKIQKSKAEKIVENDPGMHEPVFKPKDVVNGPGNEELMVFAQGKEFFCDFIVTQLFLTVRAYGGAFLSKKHEHFYMANALLQKARQSSDYESKVNKIYHNAMARVRPTLTSGPSVTTTFVQVSFFTSIETELASDPELQKEIEVIMKQIKDKSGRSNDLV